jgi:hypothetical protein
LCPSPRLIVRGSLLDDSRGRGVETHVLLSMHWGNRIHSYTIVYIRIQFVYNRIHSYTFVYNRIHWGNRFLSPLPEGVMAHCLHALYLVGPCGQVGLIFLSHCMCNAGRTFRHVWCGTGAATVWHLPVYPQPLFVPVVPTSCETISSVCSS